LHDWDEINQPGFWQLIDEAAAGFQKFTDKVATRPEDVMPWKVLGQKWHMSRKGFPPGKKPAWKPEVLEELLEMLHETVPKGQFLWNNQQVVHVMVPGVRRSRWRTRWRVDARRRFRSLIRDPDRRLLLALVFVHPADRLESRRGGLDPGSSAEGTCHWGERLIRF
jgi:hypothetical protein